MEQHRISRNDRRRKVREEKIREREERNLRNRENTPEPAKPFVSLFPTMESKLPTIKFRTGWISDEEQDGGCLNRKEDPEQEMSLVIYSGKPLTEYVSEADKREQEWNRVQHRMHPVPEAVRRVFNRTHVKLTMKFPFDKLRPVSNTIKTTIESFKEFDDSGTFGLIKLNNNNKKDTKPQSRLEQINDINTFLNTICNKYHKTEPKEELARDVYESLKSLKLRKVLPIPIKLAKDISNGMYYQSFEGIGLTLLHNSIETDPLRYYSLFVPESNNWKDEIDLINREVEIHKRRERLTFTRIRGNNCNYLSRIQNGLRTKIDVIDGGLYISNRMLVRTNYTYAQQELGAIATRYKSLSAARELTFNELTNLNCRDAQNSAGFELIFDSSEECIKFEEENKNSMKYPDSFDYNRFCHVDKNYLGTILKWYPFPSLLTATIEMEDPLDISFTMYVLATNGFHVKGGEMKFNPNNRKIEMDLAAGESWSHSTDDFYKVIEKVLSSNGLKHRQIKFLRSTDQPLEDYKIIRKIHQRLGRAAMIAGLWANEGNINTPAEEASWNSFIHKHYKTFPWTVTLANFVNPLEEYKKKKMNEYYKTHEDGSDTFGLLKHSNEIEKTDPSLTIERTALVQFHDKAFGRRVLEYLVPLTPRWDTFSLSKQDKEGVRFEPFYKVALSMPDKIRVILDKYIRAKQHELITKSNLRMKNWCHLIDHMETEQIIVEGWPISKVEAIAHELKEFFQGIIINCNEETKFMPLLYGVGLAYINKIMKFGLKYNKFMISIDHLGKNINIIGETKECLEAKAKLSEFCDLNHDFEVECTISLEEPRFLPTFPDYLKDLLFNEEKKDEIWMLRKMMDNAFIALKWNYTNTKSKVGLHFHGNPSAYNRIQETLDILQKRMIDDFTKYFCDVNPNFGSDVLSKFRDIKCPVCLNNIAHGNYRLTICGHLYCLECLRKMISYKIQSKELPLQCVYHEGNETEICGEDISIDDVMDLMFDQNFKNHPNFFESRLAPLINATTDYAIRNSNGIIKHCKKADCPGLFQKTFKEYCDERKERKVYKVAKCRVCSTEVCGICFHPPHKGNSCATEEEIRESAEKSLNYFMKKNPGKVKNCPNKCGVMIEKTEGCNHVVCLVCNIHFCWLCDFKVETEREVYKHMQDAHGSTGGDYELLDLIAGPPPGFDFPPGLDNPPGFDAPLFLENGEVILGDFILE